MKREASLARKTTAPCATVSSNGDGSEEKENSQPSLLALPSEGQAVSNPWSVPVQIRHSRDPWVSDSPTFSMRELSVAAERAGLRQATDLELRIMRENGPRELGEHVAGAGYTRVSRRGNRRVTSSNLRQLTRTPFFAHSTAREAAMCFTAIQNGNMG